MRALSVQAVRIPEASRNAPHVQVPLQEKEEETVQKTKAVRRKKAAIRRSTAPVQADGLALPAAFHRTEKQMAAIRLIPVKTKNEK